MAPKSYQKLSNLPIFSNDQFSGAMLVSASVTEGEPTKGYAWLSRGLSGAWHCLAVPLFFVVLVRGWKSTLEPKQYRSVLYSIFIETQVTSIVEGQPPQKAMSFPFKTRVIWVLGMFFFGVGSFAKSSSGRKPISMALLRMWVAHPSWTASWFIEIWIVPLSQVVVSHEQCSAGDVLFQTNWWQSMVSNKNYVFHLDLWRDDLFLLALIIFVLCPWATIMTGQPTPPSTYTP